MSGESEIINGVLIQEKYSGSIKSSRGGALTLVRKYQLRKPSASGMSQPMHQTEAYTAFQSFVLRLYNVISYPTNEGTVHMWATDISVDVEKNNYPVYSGEVTWTFEPRKLDYLVNPVSWSHSMIGGTRKRTYPAGPQRHYTAGTAPITYSGIAWDGKKYEGVECYSPEWRMTAKQQILKSVADTKANWLLWLITLSKTVNISPFQGLPAGTVLYLGADIEEGMNKNNQVYNLTHQFIIEPNLVGFQIDGIPVNFKGGHEALWTSTAKHNFGFQGTRVITVHKAAATTFSQGDDVYWNNDYTEAVDQNPSAYNMYFIGTCSTTPAANATTVEVLVNISQADVDVVPVTFQVNVAPLYAYSNLNQLLYSL